MGYGPPRAPTAPSPLPGDWHLEFPVGDASGRDVVTSRGGDRPGWSDVDRDVANARNVSVPAHEATAGRQG
jgi:hypothetical protein